MRDRNAPLTADRIEDLAWDKMNGLIPAIVQDERSRQVLMVGYMDREALASTLGSGRATFFSRSKNRLWQKGETSGHHLDVVAVHADCDDDALLVLANANGPTCHTGTSSCFGEVTDDGPGWLTELSATVKERAGSGDHASYTRGLLAEGVNRVAQKVGEEGVEVAIAAVSRPAAECAEELADLVFHVAVLMESLGLGWDEVVAILKARHSSRTSSTAAS